MYSRAIRRLAFVIPQAAAGMVPVASCGVVMMTPELNVTGERIAGPEARAAEPVLVDVHEVARMLGCSWRGVYRHCDAGALPRAVRIGRLVRWRRRDILEWIEAGCPAVRR